MRASRVQTIGSVEVTLLPPENGRDWAVRTRWLNANGTEMTRGSKAFPGEDGWIDAIAFANSILFDEWKRDPSRDRPYFDVDPSTT